jgi:deoxycytidine triphosphate deaminase
MGLLVLRSSTGRMGFIQAHTGLFDPGFEGTATMELIPMLPSPIKLYRGQRIAQLTLLRLESTPSVLYKGRYQKQSIPTEYKGEVVTAEYLEEVIPFTTEKI